MDLCGCLVIRNYIINKIENGSNKFVIRPVNELESSGLCWEIEERDEFGELYFFMKISAVSKEKLYDIINNSLFNCLKNISYVALENNFQARNELSLIFNNGAEIILIAENEDDYLKFLKFKENLDWRLNFKVNDYINDSCELIDGVNDRVLRKRKDNYLKKIGL